MKITKVTVNLSAVIPTGQYQNYKPMYQLEADMTEKDDPQTSLESLRETIRKMFAQDWNRLRNTDKMNYLSKVRWYEKDKKKFPSVTSILGWSDLLYRLRNPDKFEFGGVDEDELQEYAARGTIVHRGVQEWFKISGGGKKTEGLERLPGIIESLPDLTVERATLAESKLNAGDCNWPGFWAKYGEKMIIKFMERAVYGQGYAGRLDMYGTWDGEPAIFDIKTTSNYTERVKLKYFKQMSAYARALTGVKKPKWLVIIPLNPSNKSGFGAPLVVENDDSLFNSFMSDLRQFNLDFRDLI